MSSYLFGVISHPLFFPGCTFVHLCCFFCLVAMVFDAWIKLIWFEFYLIFLLLQASIWTTTTRARSGICSRSEPRRTTNTIRAVRNRIQTSSSTSRSVEKLSSTRSISSFLAWPSVRSPFSYSTSRPTPARRSRWASRSSTLSTSSCCWSPRSTLPRRWRRRSSANTCSSPWCLSPVP